MFLVLVTVTQHYLVLFAANANLRKKMVNRNFH